MSTICNLFFIGKAQHNLWKVLYYNYTWTNNYDVMYKQYNSTGIKHLIHIKPYEMEVKRDRFLLPFHPSKQALYPSCFQHDHTPPLIIILRSIARRSHQPWQELLYPHPPHYSLPFLSFSFLIPYGLFGLILYAGYHGRPRPFSTFLDTIDDQLSSGCHKQDEDETRWMRVPDETTTNSNGYRRTF